MTDETKIADVKEPQDADLVPYERGIPAEKAVEATRRYFAPGSALSLVVGVGLLGGVPAVGELVEFLLTLGGGVLVLSAGFWAGLELLRRWLYPDAQIDGRRSFVAGLIAPIAVFVAGVVVGASGGILAAFAHLFGVALVTAILMFFAWLSPTPDDMRGPEYEPDTDLLDRPAAE